MASRGMKTSMGSRPSSATPTALAVIGRMRRGLPRKTDLAMVSEERFAQLVQA